MDKAANIWRQFWIFQANPKQYDARRDLEIDREITWYVPRFFDRYRPGDIVYLWIAGEDAGIYGFAEVNGEAFRDKEGKQRLSIVYRGVLSKPLLKSHLAAQGRVFDGLTILRNATGTNFRVTAPEAIELNRLIGENGDTAPPNPDQFDDPNLEGEMYTGAAYVLDFRFDSESKSIIATCLAASRSINGTFFPKLLVQVLLLYYFERLSNEDASDFARALNEIIHLEKIRETLTFAEMISPLSASELSPELTAGIIVKRNVFTMLSSARRFAIKTTGREQISARHLIGTALHGATASFQNYMQEVVLSYSGLSLAEARSAFVELVEEYFPEDRLDAWEALITEELVDESGTDTFTPMLTKIDADTADNETDDLLDVDNDAIAISKILCARDAAPPLAIGLFGEWGSGKTFFMRRIRHHVNLLTARIGQSGDEAGKAYHAKVAQIWFNAWNYQDGKLWASLVNHVFAGLRQELKRLNADGADEEFKSLMEKLDEDRINEKNLRESSSRLKSLKDQEKEIRKQVSILETTNSKIEQSAAVALSDFASIKQLKKYGALIDIYLDTENAEKVLGEVDKQTESAQKIIDGFPTGFWGKARSWFEYITKSGKRLFLAAIGFSLVALVCLYIIKEVDDTLIKSVSSAITVLLATISARMSEFGRLLSLVGNISKEVERASSERRNEVQQKLDANSEKLKQLKSRLIENKAEHSKWEEDYRKLNAKYGAPSDETFANFVYARADSADYTEQLGILNTIRRDFSRLNQLLLKQKDQELPKLDRIILYIDDLDRCEPEVVVDVLQAIHLMLAFPLFMVVVGVDARWLGRSLKKRYSFLVHELDDRNNGELDYHAASTHDYLEKIFQIPFWLRRLDGNRANQMLKGLLTQKDKREPGGEPAAAEDTAEPGSDSGNGETQIPSNEDSLLFEETEDQTEGYRESSDENELLISNLVSTRALEMSGAELEFFQQLGPIVGRSPRAVKRFINLYRILKASHRNARVAGFSEKGGGFRAPLFLLAVICGSPKEAENLFQVFATANEVDVVKKVLQDSEQQNAFYRQFAGATDDTEIKTILGKLKRSKNYPARFKTMDEDAVITSVRRSLEWRTDTQAWRDLRQAIGECVDSFGDLDIKTVNEWIPEVARFSYREWVE